MICHYTAWLRFENEDEKQTFSLYSITIALAHVKESLIILFHGNFVIRQGKLASFIHSPLRCFYCFNENYYFGVSESSNCDHSQGCNC